MNILENYNKRSQSKWKMLFVGEGPLEESIKEQVKEAGLADHVIFLGGRKDVSKFYSAADMFIFPSLHEGLGIVVIEAQASGLPCIVSDAVPAEADMEIGLLSLLSLKDSLDKWCDMIETKKQNTKVRDLYKEDILNGKYNIKLIAAEMQKFYLENAR